MPAYTLISAVAGDIVAGYELAEIEAMDANDRPISLPDLARLTALPQVREFFATSGYGPDNPDELMYLARGEVTSARYDTLTVQLLPAGPAVINLTPHPVTIAGVTIAPTGPAPRCATTTTPVKPIQINNHAIAVEIVSTGDVTGLPDPAEDTIYIVSRVVAEASPHRRDLYIPHRLERDPEGRVIGCAALGQVPGYPPAPAGRTEQCHHGNHHQCRAWNDYTPDEQCDCFCHTQWTNHCLRDNQHPRCNGWVRPLCTRPGCKHEHECSCTCHDGRRVGWEEARCGAMRQAESAYQTAKDHEDASYVRRTAQRTY